MYYLTIMYTVYILIRIGIKPINVCECTRMSLENEKLILRVDLRGDALRKFYSLKSKYNFENNTDLIRFLISQQYEREFGQ